MCLVCLSVFIAQRCLLTLSGQTSCFASSAETEHVRGKGQWEGENKHSVLKSPKYQKHCLPFTFIRHSLFIQESLPVIVLSATNFIKGLFVELHNPNQSSEPPCLFGIIESRLTGCGHTLFSDGTDVNIMAAWFVLTNRSDICWPDKWSSSGYFSTLFHSLDPWPAVEVSRGLNGTTTTTWRARAGPDIRREKDIQRKKN